LIVGQFVGAKPLARGGKTTCHGMIIRLLIIEISGRGDESGEEVNWRKL
jgi:hypothetical protein